MPPPLPIFFPSLVAACSVWSFSTWKGAIGDSVRLLLIEHTTRIAFQEKTRRELDRGEFQKRAGTPLSVHEYRGGQIPPQRSLAHTERDAEEGACRLEATAMSGRFAA